MTLNFNSTGQPVESSQGETAEIKPVVLQFQPVIVSGGQQVVSPPPAPKATVTITIDPEKLKK